MRKTEDEARRDWKVSMDDEALTGWFEARKTLLETSDLAGIQPWQQSGVGLHTPHSVHDWEVLRRPIAECIITSGTFLDIGCANGCLLECLLRWTRERGLLITPYGLDFSEKLLVLSQKRLSQYADHLFLGNAWDWSPPQTFDYVNTTLNYVAGDAADLYPSPAGALRASWRLSARYGVSRENYWYTRDQDR
jgi:SAM-dependent methyltransferase